MQTSPSVIRRPRDIVLSSSGSINRQSRTQSKPFSKTAAISAVLLHVFLAGIVAGSIDYLATSALFSRLKGQHEGTLMLMYASHSIAVLRLLLYPLFGFMADVCFGRYWMVVASVFLMAFSALVTSVSTPLYQEFWAKGEQHSLITTLMVIGYVPASVGIAGFEANIVQFGLDQLMDSSSRHLSLYLHLLVWIRQIGVAVAISPFTLLDCDAFVGHKVFHGNFRFLPLVYLPLFITVPLVTLIRMRKGFYRELGNINPYKMVIKVIGHILKNPKPQRRRSAFYYYGLNPGRLDYAKVHYGGPFSTEDVENVKTVLQILAVMVCVGPVFILKVSTSYFIYQHFVQHFVRLDFIREHCSVFWPLMGSGNQMNILSVVIFPLYILAVFKLLKNIPKILLRLFLGLVMATLSLACFLLIELAGYSTFNADAYNKTVQCALAMPLGPSESVDNSLELPWASLIPPNLLYALASQIIYTTIFEFISAQSPKSMTGLLIGTFFFIVGIFQLLGMVIVTPFTQKRLWTHEGMHNSTYALYDSLEYTEYDDYFEERPSVPWTSTACEMWYLSVIVVFGILGIILFSVAARKYKYRKREEKPFPQSDIEDIVTRGIEEEETQNLLDVASVEVQRRGGVSYGTGETFSAARPYRDQY